MHKKQLDWILTELHQEKEKYVSLFLSTYAPSDFFNPCEIQEKLKTDNIRVCEQRLSDYKYKIWIEMNGEQRYPEMIITFNDKFNPNEKPI